MNERFKKILEQLAGEVRDFRVYFQKPFCDGEWVAATDCYAVIRFKMPEAHLYYPPLSRNIDVSEKFPPKNCKTLVDIEFLRDCLKDEGYTDWASRLDTCYECEGDGKVYYTYLDSF